MTVKIKNTKLFKAYKKAIFQAPTASGRLTMFIDATGKQSLFDESDGELIDVINAILNHEDVELVSPNYRLKLNGMVGKNGQQYISRRADKQGGYFICGARNPHVRQGEVIQQFPLEEARFLADLLNNSSLEEVK